MDNNIPKNLKKYFSKNPQNKFELKTSSKNNQNDSIKIYDDIEDFGAGSMILDNNDDGTIIINNIDIENDDSYKIEGKELSSDDEGYNNIDDTKMLNRKRERYFNI
jgi:hypothetical protein